MAKIKLFTRDGKQYRKCKGCGVEILYEKYIVRCVDCYKDYMKKKETEVADSWSLSLDD